MKKRGLIVAIILFLSIGIVNSVDYPTHSTLYTNEIKPVSDPPAGSGITASTTVIINAAGKITRFNYNGDYLDVDLGKFIVKSDGKVGIGTTSPATKLDVNGQVRTGTGGGSANGLLVQPNVVLPGAYSNLYAVSPADETLVLQSWMGKPLSLNPGGNNVGIGTTNPIAPLDVVGPPTGNGITIRASGGGDVVLNPGGSLFFDGVYSYAGNYIRPVAPNTQTFVTSGAERMRITSGGSVGIGTTIPAAKLHILGSSQNTLALDSPAYPELTFRVGGVIKSYDAIATTAGGYYTTSGAGDRIIRADAGNILFGNSQSENVRITTAGNVGIGTATPGYKLDVAGTFRVTGASTLDSSLMFTQGSSARNVGVIGTYDPTRLAAIWAMGSSYQLGSGGTAGNLFGLSYSYEPDYNGVGNNPGAISGLGHQMQWRANGVTQTAIGTGIYTIGNVRGTGLCIGTDCRTSWPAGGTSQWTTSGSNIYYSTGNVGIGTSIPYGALHVTGPQGAGSWTYLGGNAGGAATPNAGFTTGLAMAWNPTNGEGESVLAYGIGLGAAPRLDFASWNGATLSKVMTLRNNNVGIGTMYPQYKLEVIGNIRTSGDITAGSIYAPNLAGGIITASGNIGAQGDIAANGKVKATNIGTTFTRWGRNDCPSLTTLVYDGYVAGSHAGHGGSGKNTLCLSKTPLWLNYNDADNNGNLLYGTEFQTNDGGLSTTMGYLQDYEAQCAVCLVNDATMTLMVPGTYACPSGWTKQYYGYLMATHYTQGGSETVCVDYAAQGFISNANNDQSLWYSTEAECGSLPCPPYVQNREVTCAVCTK